MHRHDACEARLNQPTLCQIETPMTDRKTSRSQDPEFDAPNRDTRDRAPRCTALAPLPLPEGSDRVATGDRAPRPFAITRHDSSFVAQLIATATHAPQTRVLRRASPEDAYSSYRSAADHVRRQTPVHRQATSRVA
jgi:hypothetical protein